MSKDDRKINELTKLFKKHIQTKRGSKQEEEIENEFKNYGCNSSAEAFKKIREYRRKNK